EARAHAKHDTAACATARAAQHGQHSAGHAKQDTTAGSTGRGVSLPSITDIYTSRCVRKATSVVDDHTPHTTPHHTTPHHTTQHNTTQHNTTQHNTTQHNTTQHN